MQNHVTRFGPDLLFVGVHDPAAAPHGKNRVLHLCFSIFSRSEAATEPPPDRRVCRCDLHAPHAHRAHQTPHTTLTTHHTTHPDNTNTQCEFCSQIRL